MTSERTRMVRFVAFMAGSFPDRIHRRTVSGWVHRTETAADVTPALLRSGEH